MWPTVPPGLWPQPGLSLQGQNRAAGVWHDRSMGCGLPVKNHVWFLTLEVECVFHPLDVDLSIGLYSANETLVVVTCTKALPISALGLLS